MYDPFARLGSGGGVAEVPASELKISDEANGSLQAAALASSEIDRCIFIPAKEVEEREQAAQI